MHILLAVLSIVGAVMIWIIRAGMVARSTREIGEAAGDVLGAARRRRIRKKATASPLTTLEDPRDAVLAILVGLAKAEGDMTEVQARYLERVARDRLGFSNGAEALAHARWLCADVVEPGQVVQRVFPLISRHCTQEQKEDLLDLMSELSRIGSEPTTLQQHTINKLAYDLGLRKTI